MQFRFLVTSFVLTLAISIGLTQMLHYWERQIQDEPCYYGRYSRRVFLKGD